jgi:steroid delta-isomerase-like uncharacterized protein
MQACLLIITALYFNFLQINNFSIEENRKIGLAFLENLSYEKTDRFIELFATNAVYEEVASARIYNGHQQIRNYIQGTLNGIPDSSFDLQNMAVSEDIVAIEWIWKGTNTVGWPFMDIPATNKYFELKGASFIQVENGMITSVKDYWDWNSFIKGIGAQ